MIRRHGIPTAWALALAPLAFGSPASGEIPSVSTFAPGEEDAVPVVAAACPTFHWAAPAGLVEGVELRISRLIGTGDELEARPVLGRRLPVQARIWTPYVGDCLEPGGFYAWSLRPWTGDGEPGDWSDPRYFQVAETPAEARAPRGNDTLGAEVRDAVELRGEAVRGSGAAPGGPTHRSPSPREHATVGAIERFPDSPDPERLRASATSSTVRLEVGGAVRASAFRYDAPRARVHPVPAIAFRPGGLGSSDRVRYGNGYSCLAPSSSATEYLAYAEVHLADGSVIDTFRCHAFDNDPNADGVWSYALLVQEHGANFVYAPWQITIDSSGSSSEALSGTATTASPITVENSKYQYFVRLSYERDVGSSNSLNLLNLGCRIEYSINVVSAP